MTNLEAVLKALGEALTERDQYKEWWLAADRELTVLKGTKGEANGNVNE